MALMQADLLRCSGRPSPCLTTDRRLLLRTGLNKRSDKWESRCRRQKKKNIHNLFSSLRKSMAQPPLRLLSISGAVSFSLSSARKEILHQTSVSMERGEDNTMRRLAHLLPAQGERWNKKGLSQHEAENKKWNWVLWPCRLCSEGTTWKCWLGNQAPCESSELDGINVAWQQQNLKAYYLLWTQVAASPKLSTCSGNILEEGSSHEAESSSSLPVSIYLSIDLCI